MFQSNSKASVIDTNSKIKLLHGTFDVTLWVTDQPELELNIDHNINLSSTMRNDPISMLDYKYNHISAERLRRLCICNKLLGSSEQSVKAFTHIKECEYWK